MMPDADLHDRILIVVGASLRAEEADRPLAARLATEVEKRLGPDFGRRVTVVTDVLYLNDENLADCPAIALGGPGVNGLSALLLRQLPSALAIDHKLIIQLDPEREDRRCCLWGMDHELTVAALELFIEKGYLDFFLEGLRAGLA